MPGDRPYLGHGVGLRRRHYERALRGELDVDWVEVISENFFGEGGRPLAVLERVRADMPVVLHGVSLGIGSPEPPPADYLRRLRRLIDRIDPAWVSDHLCWGHLGGVYSHELLPLPLTEAALDRVVRRVDAVQEALGRQILLENVSSYLTFQEDSIPEWEFLAEVARRAGSLVLLDLNNILVSAHNHGFDPDDYLRGVPGERVWQFHLARHSDRGAYHFDDHCGSVLPELWSLYEAALRLYGPVSSIVEWDEGVPEWALLRAEQREARSRAEAIFGPSLIPGGAVAVRPIAPFIPVTEPVLKPSPQLGARRSLSESQEALWRALRTPGGSAVVARETPELDRSLASLIGETVAFPRGDRIDVYAQSTTWRLRGALAEIFPALLWLLGESGFNALAAQVIAKAPSSDPDLGRFGAGLPGVLEATSWAGEDPWLVDVARCEWTMAELLDAADPPGPVLTPAALEAVSPARWPSLRLEPIPALRVLRGGVDQGSLWACRDRGDPPAAGWAAARSARESGEGASSLVWRRGFEVFRRSVSEVEAVILRSLCAGQPLSGALDAGIAETPGLEPARVVGWVHRWLSDGLFAGMVEPGRSGSPINP